MINRLGGRKGNRIWGRLLVGVLLAAGKLEGETLPNIVFILADDLGYRELGCYGQEKIKTPRIDQLASEGMRFLRAYAGSPVCAPSRCVLMTGKHPGHAEVRNNRSVQPEGQHPISAEAVTLAEVLQEQGYRTGAFGKWGLGPVGSSGDPNAQGFDVFFGYNCQAHAHSYYPATLWRNDEIVALDNDPPVPGHASLADGADPADPASYAEFQGTDYASDRIHEALQAFLKEEPEKPFFLYYPSLIPHVALHVPDEDLKPYLAEGWQDPPFSRARGYGYTPHFTPRAAYAAMITRLDTYVGQVLDTLEELGKAENTLVIFTSDNGTTHLKDEVDYDFFASVGKLRGLKGSVFEGGLRVPLIVRWPGKVKAGTVSEVVTGFEDWMPTLGEMGGETTAGGGEGEGISILPALLRGEGVERSFLYREFQGYGGQQALWRGPWKAVRQGLAGKRKDGSLPEVKTELYHLVEDPSEERDVAEEQAALVSELEGLMAAARVPSEAFPIPVLDGLQPRKVR